MTSPAKTTIATADLAGKVLDKKIIPTSQDIDFMTEQIILWVSKFAAKYKDYELEVGISIPGVTDQSNGTVLYVPYFQWHDWDISRQITEKTNLRVTIDNDANAIALAELWFGQEEIRKTRNFITVLVSEGIGTGIIFDGQIYRGEKRCCGRVRTYDCRN